MPLFALIHILNKGLLIMNRLFLDNWSDILGESNEDQRFLDYEALLQSDDEFLILTSLLDERFDDE